MKIPSPGRGFAKKQKPRLVAPAGVSEIEFHQPRVRRFRPSRAGKASLRGDDGGWEPWMEVRL